MTQKEQTFIETCDKAEELVKSAGFDHGYAEDLGIGLGEYLYTKSDFPEDRFHHFEFITPDGEKYDASYEQDFDEVLYTNGRVRGGMYEVSPKEWIDSLSANINNIISQKQHKQMTTEDKTSKTNETQQEEKKVESPKQTSQERIAAIIAASLERAKTNGGILLNATQKMKPAIYDSKMQQAPFNNALIAMFSDQNDFKTNIVTFFSEAKKRGESVRGGQKGMPMPWISWSHFEKKDDPNVSVSRSEYMAMPKEEQEKYKAIRNKEMRIVFNIDQTTMPSVNKDAYEKLLEQHGNVDERTVNANTDKQLHIDVNQLILSVRDNLVPIRKDGSGVASYDKTADAVHIPAQNAYSSYPEYVQDMLRQVVAATAVPQRLNRHSSKNYETLVTELASATKLLDYGLPAKLSPKAMENINDLIDMMKEKPHLVDSIEKDVNSTLNMIQKAQRGEKIEKRPTPQELDRWHSNLPKEGTVPDKFDSVLMMKDLSDKWTLFVKPEGEKIFAVHPTQADTSLFFNFMRGVSMENTETFRMEMGQKYYAEVAKHPEKAIDVFGEKMDSAEKNAIDKALVFKTKDEEPKILIMPTLTTGEKLKPRELTKDQWQMMWLAPDMKDFKKTLAATIFKDEISEKIGTSQQQNQEQKTEQKEPVTLDIPKWAVNYIVNGDAEGLTDEEKEIVDKFLDENYADGFVPEIIEGSDKEFNVSPAFGTRNPNALPDKGESPYQAVDTVQIRFNPAGYFESRNDDQTIETGEVVVDNRKEQTFDPEDQEEDKECTRLLNQIAKLEEKCRKETQPNRQREMFLELKELKAKLDERVAMLRQQAEEKDQKIKNSPEQKKKEEIEEKAKEEATKQETKAIAKVALSPMLKQFMDLKKKHPDALLLFRCGDFYETYQKDAEKASKILGITLTHSTKTKDQNGKPLAMAGFPYHALDTYLPKLIRAGERVAICDQIEAPKQTTKRGVTELLTPGSTKEQEQKSAKEPPKEEQQEARSRGFHR